MSLAASTIQNFRTLLTTGSSGIYTAKIYEIACIEGYNAGDCSGKQNHVWELLQREKTGSHRGQRGLQHHGGSAT